MNQIFNVVVGVVFGLFFMPGLFAQVPTPLRVGVILNHSSEDVITSFDSLMQYVAGKLGTEAVVEIVAEEDLASRLEKGDFDLGVFSPFAYLKARQNFPGLEVFATHAIRGKKSYQGCILVRKESGIKSLEGLEGKNFQYVNKTSTAGYKYPRGALWEHDLDVDRGFFNYDFSDEHKQSLTKLLRAETDGIAVTESEMEYLDPEDKQLLRCLLTYEIPYDAYVFRSTLSHSVREQIKKIMFTAHHDPAARRLFSDQQGIEKWVPQSEFAYKTLQRYQRVIRVKPALQLTMEIKAAALEKLSTKGDLLAIIEENIISKLNESGRFSSVGNHSPESLHKASLNIALIGDIYECSVFLNDKLIRQSDFSEADLRTSLPKEVKYAVLENMIIECEVLANEKKEWFITYGIDDGITPEEYRFELIETGTELLLKRMSFLNTFFQVSPEIKEGMTVHIHYQPGREELAFSSYTPIDQEKPQFWDSLDNVWGVIGLVVAFLSVAIGSYFTNTKKKRFKNLLYSCNDALLQYLKGHANAEELILQKKAEINQTLEKGLIREDQFLILIHRLEDIEYVINDYFHDISAISPKIRAEIDIIIKDNIITEGEYTRIIALIKSSFRSGSPQPPATPGSPLNTDV